MKIKQFLIAVCIGTMFTACSSRDDYNVESEKQLVRINASIKGMETRSTDATQIQNTSFVDGAKINVTASHRYSYELASGLPESGYAVFTKSGGSWTTDTPFYNFGSVYPIDVLAIHPSTNKDALITEDTEIFEVQSNQKTDDGYRQSDLMTAEKETASPTVDLEFEHCLTKITIVLKANAQYTLEELKEKISYVKVQANIKANISFNWSTVSVTATSDNRQIDIDGSNEELCTNGVSCIIPPQTITGDFIIIGDNEDNNYAYKIPAEGFTFEPKHEYIFNLSLEKSAVTLSEPTIVDWTEVTKETDGIAN